MNHYLTQLDFTTLDYIFSHNTKAYCEYLEACIDTIGEAAEEINLCYNDFDCDKIQRVRHRIQPNLELLGLMRLKEDLLDFEEGKRASNDKLFNEIHQSFPALIDALRVKLRNF
jgi:hypothetical protein